MPSSSTPCRTEPSSSAPSPRQAPQLGGRELARRLAGSRPGLAVVFMSGYTDDDVARRGLLDENIPFQEKPLSPAVLLRTMREVLEAGRRNDGHRD